MIALRSLITKKRAKGGQKLCDIIFGRPAGDPFLKPLCLSLETSPDEEKQTGAIDPLLPLPSAPFPTFRGCQVQINKFLATSRFKRP